MTSEEADDALPEQLSHLRGIESAPPDEQLVPYVESRIRDAVANIPKGRHNVLVTLVTEKEVNAAFVRVHNTDRVDFAVAAYIGKAWDGPIAVGLLSTTAW